MIKFDLSLHALPTTVALYLPLPTPTSTSACLKVGIGLLPILPAVVSPWLEDEFGLTVGSSGIGACPS